MVSVSDTLSAISDDKSLVLFYTIALASGDSSILISRLNLTRKQYYSRMSDLTNAGLTLRKNGKYFLTSFGSVVYEAQELIGNALQYWLKLKAIDSIESPEFPVEERDKLIDYLINNSKMKAILFSPQHNNIAQKAIPDNKELNVPALTKRSTMQFNP